MSSAKTRGMAIAKAAPKAIRRAKLIEVSRSPSLSQTLRIRKKCRRDVGCVPLLSFTVKPLPEVIDHPYPDHSKGAKSAPARRAGRASVGRGLPEIWE